MLRMNDPLKHKVLYTWELYDVIINFQCVQELLFLRIINSKQSQIYYKSYIVGSLDYEGLLF